MSFITRPPKKQIVDFMIESNKIEGVEGTTGYEVSAFEHFIGLDQLYGYDVISLVGRLQPGAHLRSMVGNDVWVGDHQAPSGGPPIAIGLADVIATVDLWKQGLPDASPYKVHRDYESLHPFTDGNGRSGRAIWAWQMLHAPVGTREMRVGLQMGFLHEFYYQTLAASDGRIYSRFTRAGGF